MRSTLSNLAKVSCQVCTAHLDTMPAIPSLTPARSPTASPVRTPGCLQRRNDTIARVQNTTATPPAHRVSILTWLVRTPLTDLYANRPQHQFVYYLIFHMLLFYAVYQRQQDGCLSDRHGQPLPWNGGLLFAWYDEILPFCLYTALAICYFRDWRTVSKWEYLAMLVSWAKSFVVLRASYISSKNGAAPSGVGFPDNPTDYVVFGVVRFLVFGGLYKMVQAGLSKKWERAWKLPTRVARLHRPVPAALQRRIGGGVGRQRVRDPLDTLEGRKAYWEEIRKRGW